MKIMTNIFVGCGGTGAKVALQLSKLMGEDPKWRYEMDENVYFFLLDTDQKDLDKYASEIHTCAPDVYVSSFLTSDGFGTPGEILSEFIPGLTEGSAEQQLKSLNRFSEHWWCSRPDAADAKSIDMFRVPRVAQIMAGAGQVPMVSFLAAWQAMKGTSRNVNSIEKELDKLCTEIGNRRVDINFSGDNPLGEFNIFFVGSVAGGTGRGCVIPIAFKMKEVFFSRFGRIPFISGYFLDQDCFQAGRRDHEVLPQMMNAMTGWSEMSSWLALYEKEHSKTGSANVAYGYSLPGLTATHDPDYDVLHSPMDGEFDLKDALRRDRARLPLDAIGVIGSRSGMGYAADGPEDVYRMVATAMYVRLTQSEIDSEISNEGRTYFSVGSSISEIPCHEIEEYFNLKARFDAANSISAVVSESDLKNEASRVMTWLGLSDPLGCLLEDATGEEITSAMQLFVRELAGGTGMFESDLAPLTIALDDQNIEDCETVLAAKLSETRLDDPQFLAQIAKVFLEQFIRFHQRSGEELAGLDGVIEGVLGFLVTADKSVLRSSGSAYAVSEVARHLIAGLRDTVDEQLSKKGIEGWLSDSTAGRRMPSAITVLTETKDREGFLGVAGKRFTEDEKTLVRDETTRELRVLYARALGKVLSSPRSKDGNMGLVSQLGARLEDLRSNANMLVKAVDYCRLVMDLDSEKLRSMSSKLFVGERLEQSLSMDVIGSAGFNIRRRICPIEPDADELDLDNPAALSVISKNLVGPILKGEAGDHPRLTQELETSLSIAKYYYKGDGKAGRQNIKKRFELAPALRGLATRWRKYLDDERKQGRDRYEELAQKFRNFFGITPKLLADSTVTISGDNSLVEAAADDYLLLGLCCVSARSCRPFWQTTRATNPKLVVQIPIDLPKGKDIGWKTIIQENANMGNGGSEDIRLIPNQVAGSKNEHNPYILAVYTSAGVSNLDEVLSLSAWRDNPTLRRCLVNAESKEIPMPFRGDNDMWEGYRGSGFSDPSY
ncbi:MAG: tubulin-like doman-containing protein, partial [Verrucomicrobiota bacterium]